MCRMGMLLERQPEYGHVPPPIRSSANGQTAFGTDEERDASPWASPIVGGRASRAHVHEQAYAKVRRSEAITH
ncbi:hypothetical protein Tdes44962_MAKER09768 [Teratosphaeria destructans]|uniref:Uncharacterized protein n=1 Tax=Teratosphaeria destructans TaxID=418781 RepID=A0A9W7SRN9_9PEZI|nr:hypothetical protein Tdes44962_MAKER09768 [Teratosphaeria destructans]